MMAMSGETSNPAEEVVKRAREAAAGGNINDFPSKRRKKQMDDGGSADEKVVRLGSLEYRSSRELHDYLNSCLQGWQPSFRIGEANPDGFAYLMDLVKQGHPEPEKLIGCGVSAFEVQTKLTCGQCRCFAVIRKDGSQEQFSFRACIDNISPLPADLKRAESGRVFLTSCRVHRKVTLGMMVESAYQRTLEEKALSLGPRKFLTSNEMLRFLSGRLAVSPLDTPLDEEMHEILLDLLKKSGPEWETKFAPADGIKSFQARTETQTTTRTTTTRPDKRHFVVVREDDGSAVPLSHYREWVRNMFRSREVPDAVDFEENRVRRERQTAQFKEQYRRCFELERESILKAP